MNQDSSFPPMLPPSTELGALLFAILPCLQDSYRPLASFAYHITELSKLKTFPSVPPLTNLRNVEALISDKDAMFRSLSYYGKRFRMPLLSTIASLLQALQFYQAYKDILPGLFAAMNGGEGSAPSFDSMAGLFSGLGGLGGGADLFSALGGFSPDILSSLFSGFSGTTAPSTNDSSESQEESTAETFSPSSEPVYEATDSPKEEPDESVSAEEDSFDLYDSLYSFLTPEQKEIYNELMNTD
ncbi:MAG: hypothetical protein IJW37_05920 [Lachnospiraceae bacterium]|nr:hypothetical protein [Lachnospiraceae bacterium]